MTEPRTIDADRNITARFAEEWHTGIWYARVTDGDFALIMRKDDYDVLATDPVALVSYFDAKRVEHAAGRPVNDVALSRWFSERAPHSGWPSIRTPTA